MFGNSSPFYSPRPFSQEVAPQSWRLSQQDDLRGAPLQRNGMFRPSGKSIYMQRKEYSETLNRQPYDFQYRVEHLFTCELDGQEMRTVDDCVAKLKSLDAKSRLWPQEMIMEVQRGYLLLSDIETKVELESLSLSCVVQTKAVLDSCAYDSLLIVALKERNKRFTRVFMFQCEETGAELVKADLDKVVQKEGGDTEPHREQFDIRGNLENIIGEHAPGRFQQAGPHATLQEWAPPPPDFPPPQWEDRQPGLNVHLLPNMCQMCQHYFVAQSLQFLPRHTFLYSQLQTMLPLWVYTPQKETVHHPDLHQFESSPEDEQAYIEINTEILNHVINDLEIFLDKVSAAVNASLLQDGKSKRKSKKKKSKKNASAASLPPQEEYISYLQKIRYGFNLLSQLDGVLTSPSAPDFVHIFFSTLGTIVPQYPGDLPPTVLSPLLTEAALQLLSQVVSPEEDCLWKSLGDSWNVPRSRYPGNVPPYTPDFYDGWQPPALPARQIRPIRSSSQRFSPGQINESRSYSPKPMMPEQPVTNGPWGSPPPPPPPPPPSHEPPLHMRVIYNYMARNNRELSVMKGDVVQVIQKSKQWWLVRSTSNEEGNVPFSVLEPIMSPGPMADLPRNTRGPVTLDMTSTPAQVKAWLEYKGFSRITVSSLGVLTGKLLLGMTKDEIRTVCPEEGGKVFFQLQAIKSAIALASESSGLYNGRY
uniref:epidermal growth factor receptor kinase substrate 8-like protein 3b n=1 Tax=Monopterus albus TaxID=43700 RepID=UPI0009B31453|nr:epidermal growth factor receptor kinase substrate 8-like protein 3 [Monopterus albus]